MSGAAAVSSGAVAHCRVGGDLAATPVRQVAAGASFTVAVTLDGKVYQMGETGASVRAKWEGAKTPELVTRPLLLHHRPCGRLSGPL
jgi:alpha-tubulin suppressor-like RCC1 family protein